MSDKVTIVMYHYVRDLKRSRYPKIKGLDLSLFIEQIEYLKKHYTIIKMEELIEALDNNLQLPPKAALLTFDDAYIDHFLHVFPILDKNKIQGSFFPSVKAICHHTVLDVNKIHFILASVDNEKTLINDIFRQLDKYRSEFKLKENNFYFDKLASTSRYDTKETVFIKKLLQVELEEKLRNIMIDNLFQKYISNDEAAFSAELYMNKEQIACMKRNGMHIGNHGYNHYWLSSLTKEEQEFEIKKSLEFIESVDVKRDYWTMCYPFGNYNDETISILKENGCKLGLTTTVNVANIKTENRFKLSRLNTNDIPKSKEVEVNSWFEKG